MKRQKKNECGDLLEAFDEFLEYHGGEDKFDPRRVGDIRGRIKRIKYRLEKFAREILEETE